MGDQNKGFFADIGQRVAERLGERASRASQQTGEELNQNSGLRGRVAEVVSKGADNLIDQATKRNSEIIAGVEKSLNPDQKEATVILEESISPGGGIFRRLFSGLLNIGARVSGFITALWTDKFCGTNNLEENSPRLTNIFAKFFSYIFAEKKKPTEKAVPAISPNPMPA